VERENPPTRTPPDETASPRRPCHSKPTHRKPIAGVQFDSRHGDELKLWALFERAGDENVSTRVTGTLDGPIEIDDNDLNEEVRIHRLHGTT